MFAHVMDYPGGSLVVVWDSKERKEKIVEKYFDSREAAIDWLADDSMLDIDAIKTEGWPRQLEIPLRNPAYDYSEMGIFDGYGDYE